MVDEPDNPLPKHYLAACTGVAIPDRAADAYVEAVFDSFANSFDAKLASLTYRAPELVGVAVAAHCGPPLKNLDVLDAGCGTGLCGSYLSPFARRLTGVDLSTQMLAKARARGMFDELEKAELTEFLRARTAAFDLVVSADTLCYFGALESVSSAACGVLRRDGLFAFTVEALADDSSSDYKLHPHGRYSHRHDYVARVLRETGFERTEIEPVDLRNENGKPVAGWLVTARRAREPLAA